MSTDAKSSGFSRLEEAQYFDAGSTTLTASLVTVATRKYGDGGGHFAIVLSNTHASVAFTNVTLDVQMYPSGDWFNLKTGAGWATTDTVLEAIVASAGVINTLAHDQSAYARFSVGPCYAWRIQVQTGSAGTAALKGGQDHR